MYIKYKGFNVKILLYKNVYVKCQVFNDETKTFDR